MQTFGLSRSSVDAVFVWVPGIVPGSPHIHFITMICIYFIIGCSFWIQVGQTCKIHKSICFYNKSFL